MQARILQSEKVENMRILCMEMWKTLEKPQKYGPDNVENPVDAVDSTQFGHKFISGNFYSFPVRIHKKRTPEKTIKDG